MSFVNATNRSVARIDLQALQGRDPSGWVELMRGDLSAILHEATRDRVEYVFGDSVTALAQDRDGVDVTFAGGGERRFDLVVGADGAHSSLRRLAFGAEAQFVRYLGFYGVVAAADPALGEERWVTSYNVPGKMAGVYRSGNHQEARAHFMFHQPKPLEYDYRDVEQHKGLLRDAFAGVGWRVPELLTGAMADPDLYLDWLSQVRMPSWSSGRVALVGDAAWCASPLAGAGAMLAMVGAYRLAGEIGSAAGDHQLAFRRYEEACRPLVERSQAQLFTGLVVPRTRIGIWLRNTVARLPMLSAMAGIERQLELRRRESLPDYSSSALPSAS
jgi:2-polyprenyl-6-methoxyphenol hydroxylase-like FAD-dependent oxidoreductase